MISADLNIVRFCIVQNLFKLHYSSPIWPTVRLDKISTHLIELQIIIINSYFISDLSTFIDICIPTSFDWFLGTLFHITTYLLRNIFTFFLISCATLLFSFAMLKWTKKRWFWSHKIIVKETVINIFGFVSFFFCIYLDPDK